MSRWRFDLSSGSDTALSRSLPRPLGYEANFDSDEQLSVTAVSADKERAQKEQEAMRLAMSPGGGLLSTAFMLWMSGSSLQIFSIMMIGMAFVNPIKAISSVNSTFSRFDKDQKPISTRMPKLIFIGIQLVALCLALYKLSTMGLLPLTSADWVAYIPPRLFAERSGVPVFV